MADGQPVPFCRLVARRRHCRGLPSMAKHAKVVESIESGFAAKFALDVWRATGGHAAGAEIRQEGGAMGVIAETSPLAEAAVVDCSQVAGSGRWDAEGILSTPAKRRIPPKGK